jgi:RHS repeat-associated protein
MVQRVEGGVTTTIGWNYDNKPTSITKGSTTVSFTYDGNGQRVKKTSSSQTVFYFGELYEVRNGVEILQLFAGSRRIASIRLTDGKNQFYHPNHLGSASVITDQNGARKEQIEYHPFGTYRDVGSPTGTYDYDAQFPDVNYTFTDQEDDDEFGFYNYGARLYDPVLGRFISPDSMVPDPEDPQALNRYTYCLNNPLIYTDPSGEFIDWVVFGFFVLFGAFIGAGMAAVNNQNIFVGAVVGAFTAAVSMGVGYGVTAELFPAAFGAESFAGLSPGLRIAATAAGGFTGGAVSSGTTSAVYGGNVWQAALYGGLGGAAMAGLVAGAIELNNWVNGTEMGGGKATGRLMPKDVKPDTDLPQWKFEDLFDSKPGGFKEYLEPRPGHLHDGIDVKPESFLGVNKPFQTLAPGKIRIESFGWETGYGTTVNVTAVGYSKDLIIKFGHQQLLEGLKVGSIVEKGTPFIQSNLTGNITGYHDHISVIFEGNYYNPRFIFK